MFPVVAIDGPAASGKSTLSRLLAGRFQVPWVSSGLLYRAVTFAAGQSPLVPPAELATEVRFETSPGADAGVRLRDRLLTMAELRGAEVNASVSRVAQVPAVRAGITACLREAALHGPLIMEGRDIGTVVFPHTPFKVYLEASAATRAAPARR